MKGKQTAIDISLVHRLIASQFPKWKELAVDPVALSGWDNRIFRLGKDMLVRLPSAAEYELQVDKEHQWLPRLGPDLPLPIPVPIAKGKPEHGYPWKWSIYQWLEGETAASAPITDLAEFAADLAKFLSALQSIDATGGPSPRLHSFCRGGPLSIYGEDVHRAISLLRSKVNENAAIQVWERALATSWRRDPVWVHGDISAGNLLVQEGKLCAVIDFGQLAIGDPACDLAISWTLFHGKSRAVFQEMLPLDPGTWDRARAWALWKALITAAGFTDPRNFESEQCWRIIEEVLK